MSSLDLSERQVELAVRAVMTKAAQGKESAMLGDDETVWLQIGFKQVPEHQNKARRIPLPHSLYDSPSCDICLITKDLPKDEQEALEEAVKKGTRGRIVVMPVRKLKSDFKPYEAKRQLCASYDLFLADDRIVPILPRLLGKQFFVNKKKPAPVELRKKALSTAIIQARDAAWLYVGQGTCSALRIGTTEMKAKQVVANVMAAVKGVSNATKKKASGIQSIQVKTDSSISIPIYNSIPTVEDYASDPLTKPLYEKHDKNGPKRRKGNPMNLYPGEPLLPGEIGPRKEKVKNETVENAGAAAAVPSATADHNSGKKKRHSVDDDASVATIKKARKEKGSEAKQERSKPVGTGASDSDGRRKSLKKLEDGPKSTKRVKVEGKEQKEKKVVEKKVEKVKKAKKEGKEEKEKKEKEKKKEKKLKLKNARE